MSSFLPFTPHKSVKPFATQVPNSNPVNTLEKRKLANFLVSFSNPNCFQLLKEYQKSCKDNRIASDVWKQSLHFVKVFFGSLESGISFVQAIQDRNKENSTYNNPIHRSTLVEDARMQNEIRMRFEQILQLPKQGTKDVLQFFMKKETQKMLFDCYFERKIFRYHCEEDGKRDENHSKAYWRYKLTVLILEILEKLDLFRTDAFNNFQSFEAGARHQGRQQEWHQGRQQEWHQGRQQQEWHQGRPQQEWQQGRQQQEWQQGRQQGMHQEWHQGSQQEGQQLRSKKRLKLENV